MSGYPTDTYTTPNDYIQRLRGDGVKTGTGILLRVMSGDKVNVRVNSYFASSGLTPGSTASPLTDLLTALTTAIPGVSGSKYASSQLSSSVLTSDISGASGFLTQRDASNVSTKPKAYLNMVLLDEQLNPVITNNGKNSYFKQVSTDGSLETHTVTARELTKNGYLYIYVSNETQNIYVYFDNLQVTQVRSPLISESHYNSWGLELKGISSSAAGSLLNRNKYNDKELQNGEFSDGSGLEWYDYGARDYDHQVGMWHVIDPLADKARRWSGYTYAYDDPIIFVDPDGMEAGDAYGAPDGTQSAFNSSANYEGSLTAESNSGSVSGSGGSERDKNNKESKACCKEIWKKVTDATSNGIDNLKVNLQDFQNDIFALIIAGVIKLDDDINDGTTLPQVLLNDFKSDPLGGVTGIGSIEVKALEPLLDEIIAKRAAASETANGTQETGASLSTNGVNLSKHLEQLEKYGQAGFNELQNGRFRYYGNTTPATKPGEMIGRRLVREWNPATGYTRTWMETLDNANNIRIVRPETGGTKVHYMFNQFGKYTGKW